MTDSSGISFTAHYTNEVWQRNGLSSPFLATRQWRRLYDLSRPLEWGGKWLFGINNEMLLLQRHHIIDHRLATMIREQGVRQVVEIACGLSPRGTSFREQFADLGLLYVEADLPAMAERKRHLLADAGLLGDRHRVVSCDILAEGGPDSLAALFARELDPALPTVVITEGLVNYFDLPTIHGFWTRLAGELRRFPLGIYVNDLYPNLQWHPAIRYANAFRALLAQLTHSSVTLHFDSEADIVRGFQNAGFHSVSVHLPESWYGVLDIPVQRIPSIVRVVESVA